MFHWNHFRRVAGVMITFPIFIIVSSCGPAPSFTENGLAGSSADATGAAPGNSDGSSTTGDGSMGQNQTTGQNNGGGTNGGGSAGGGGAGGGGNSGGSTTSGGESGGGGGQVWVPPADYPRDTPKEDVLTEDGGTLDLPGVKAVKVGVNFEDLNDFDFNDSVLCFTGSFKVDKRSVVSYKKQSIVANIYTNSSCGHIIHVQIKDKDGNILQKFKYNDRQTRTATLDFDVGSRLFVIMENFPDSGCIGPIGMNHPDRVQVAANVCRR